MKIQLPPNRLSLSSRLPNVCNSDIFKTHGQRRPQRLHTRNFRNRPKKIILQKNFQITNFGFWLFTICIPIWGGGFLSPPPELTYKWNIEHFDLWKGTFLLYCSSSSSSMLCVADAYALSSFCEWLCEYWLREEWQSVWMTVGRNFGCPSEDSDSKLQSSQNERCWNLVTMKIFCGIDLFSTFQIFYSKTSRMSLRWMNGSWILP